MKRKLLLINLSISICTLLAMEMLGQVSFFLMTGKPLFEGYRDAAVLKQVFEMHPYLVGRLKKNIRVSRGNKTITTTDIHTRWTGAPQDDQHSIRVAVLGGSTTFGANVTDTDSWPAILQETLGNGYSVLNYGVPGYSTAEAIIQMALIVPESNPHIVIFYEGWNDIRNYHESHLGSDYFSHGMTQYRNLGIHKSLAATLVQTSAIFKIANKIISMWHQEVQNRLQANNEVYTTADPFVDRIYLRNLKTLKTLAQSLGAKVLFIPQVLNYTDFKDKKRSSPWSPHIEDNAMSMLLDRFNSIINYACHSEEPNCIVLKEVLSENWRPNDFVDSGHFNRTGGIKFSMIVAKYITRL